MGTTREAVSAINLHLVPLIAHDRAGFGGALVSFGPAIGYLSVTHLGPAVLGCFVFALGLALAALDSSAFS
jgi:hypothetical protein